MGEYSPDLRRENEDLVSRHDRAIESYQKMLPHLHKYAGRYIAFCEGRVLAVGKDEYEAMFESLRFGNRKDLILIVKVERLPN